MENKQTPQRKDPGPFCFEVTVLPTKPQHSPVPDWSLIVLSLIQNSRCLLFIVIRWHRTHHNSDQGKAVAVKHIKMQSTKSGPGAKCGLYSNFYWLAEMSLSISISALLVFFVFKLTNSQTQQIQS